MTITVTYQKAPSGNAIKLPISAVVPNNINPQDLQLCASLAEWTTNVSALRSKWQLTLTCQVLPMDSEDNAQKSIRITRLVY